MNYGKNINPLKDLCKLDRDIWVTASNTGIEEKEIRESLDFCAKVRDMVRGKKVLEVCSGHGLVGNILVKKYGCKQVTQVDLLDTKAGFRSIQDFNNNSRVYKELLNINEYEKMEDLEYDCVVGVHCCGDLTDAAIDIAINKKADIGVSPCCYHRVKSNNMKELFGSRGVDIIRCNKLFENGYTVSIRKMKSNITKMDKIIIGRKKDEERR